VAELIFTAEGVRPFGAPAPNVPMLLDDEMRLIEPACLWLMHIALVRGRTRSRQTWRAYGEVIYDWWQTLEANGWAWDEVGTGELAAYRDHMLQRSSDHTGRPYARSTINGRLRILSLFYRWCAADGLIDRAPFASGELALGRNRPAGFFAHIDASSGIQTVNDLTVRHRALLPRPLPPEAIRRVIASMNARDRLIVEWAVTTGMRRMEIAGLRLSALPKGSAQPMTAVRIDVTKGGKARVVYPPSPLLDRTWAYVREERAVVIRRAQARDPGYAESDRLFLTEHGAPMTARRVGAMFADASERAGVTAHFHALRHTFAGMMLRFLQRQADQGADLNPLLTLQTLLGHADLATTAIYLRVVATDLSVIEASVDELYEALL
jgi:site-specific recombinase XerD